MFSEDEPAYSARPEAGGFQVVDASGHMIMACRDEHSAAHYVVLLNEAFRRGFKAGYREGRGRRTGDATSGADG